MLNQVIQYTNGRILSGLIIDSDVYVPCDRNLQQLDINRDRVLAFNLACEIQKNLINFLNDANTHNKISQNKINQYFQFYILERQSTDSNRTNQDEQGNLYIRFGYHIYFPHILVNEQNKKLLKELLCKELNKYYSENISKIYHTTGIAEYFDPSPFQGTTSLPLTFPDQNKCYTKFIICQDQQVQAIPVMQCQQFMFDLDMFNGHEFEIQPQYLQNVRTNTLLNLIFKYQASSYQIALYHAYKELTLQKLANKQIIDICVQFNHIRDVLIRTELIKLLYQYFNHNEYLTQIAYFMAMAGDDSSYISMQDVVLQQTVIQNTIDLQQQASISQTQSQISTDSNKDNPIFQWLQDMKERDRAPLKAQQLVQKVISSYDKSFEKEEPIIRIIELFNRNVDFKLHNNMITQEQAIYYKQTTGIYDDFMKYKQSCYNGFLANVELEDIQRDEFKAFFLQFLHYKLRKSLNTYIDKQRNRLLYSFNDTDDKQDMYHFRKIEKEDYLSIIQSYFEKFIEDYSYVQAQRLKQSVQMMNITDQDPMKKKSQQNDCQKFLTSLIKLRQTIKQTDYENCLAELSGNNLQKQPDQEKCIFGVYNGLLEWDDNNYKFKFITGKDAKEKFITQSTMFKVQQWMLNNDNSLKDISEFENSQNIDIQTFYNAYRQIENVFKEMYMENMEVLDWKITQILLRLMYPEITCQGLFILYCSGANGKTTQSQTIMTWLGQKQQKICDILTGEQRYVHNGYISSVKSSILQTTNRQASQHDSGGVNELEGAAYACLTELDATVPIVNAQVKSLCGDTSLSTRQAYAKEAHNFVNRAFLELQTNNQVSFNQGLDYGTVRRLYQYKLIKTFLSYDQYQQKLSEVRQQIQENPQYESQYMDYFNKAYGMKDETLIQKLCNQFSYIDAGNYYCLMTFQRFYRQHHTKDYVPKILLDSQLTIMKESHKLFSSFVSQLVQSDGDDLLYSSIMFFLKNYLQSELGLTRGTEINKQIMDYEYLFKTEYISHLYALDKESGEQIHININQFSEYDIKDYKFTDAQKQYKCNQDRIAVLKQAGFEVEQPKVQNYQQYQQQMYYQQNFM